MFGGLVLPSQGGAKARGGSLHTRSSCAASFGGLVSTNSGEKAHGRRHGSLERLPKESYAQALREQIAVHGGAEGGPQRGPTLEQDPFVGDSAASKRAAAAQLGGKAAFLEKGSYASALRDQIALRDAYRAADGARGRAASPMLMQQGGPAEGAPRPGKRCLPPPMPSRESYAAALEEQIAAREAARHSTVSPPLGTPGPAAMMLAEPEKLRGRRHMGPLDSHDKGAYAAELREQMVARNMRSAAARALSQEPSCSGLDVGVVDGAWALRGKRQVQQIPGTSKEDLTRALQEQMANRAAQKAAGAYHLQADGSELPPPPEQRAKGKRQAAASEPPPTREAYAAALEEQMKEHRMRRAAQLADDFMAPTGGAVIGGAAREAAQAARGRRHSSQIELPSKQALGSALREQMVDRGGPCKGGAAELVRQDQAYAGAPALPPRVPSAGSRPRDFEETHNLIVQEAARQPDALDMAVLSAEGAMQGGGREAGTNFGGLAGGLSSTAARRIRFADESVGAPETHERTLAARMVDERADELRRLLDGEGARAGPSGENPW